jgi:hypothetical protein
MVGEAGETAICNAYATLDNAGLKASRFVGPVEIRGARGHVWLHGRRIPTWWLWVRGGGRITGFLFRAAWIAACFSSDWVPVPRPRVMRWATSGPTSRLVQRRCRGERPRAGSSRPVRPLTRSSRMRTPLYPRAWASLG